jgi:hypothetical protein
MKRTGFFFLLLIVSMFFGCATMDDLKGSITAKVTSITSTVDPNLVAKVPEDKRGEFPKAEFAVKVAEEKLKLSRLKSELAAKQEKLAGYEEDLFSLDVKGAGLDYDIVKLEAINATTGLGKKEDIIKTLTNLKLKKNELQADLIKTDGNIVTVKQQISDLTDKIKAQEETIKGLAMEKAKPEGKPAVSAEKGQAAAEKVAEEKPKEAAPVDKDKMDKGNVMEEKPKEAAPVEKEKAEKGIAAEEKPKAVPQAAPADDQVKKP